MDIPSGIWLPELEMQDPRDFMNQRQHTCPYSELMDSFSSQSSKGYLNLVTRNESMQSATINGDLDKQESYKDTKTSSFTISFGDLASPTGINQNQPFGEYKLKCHDAIKVKEEMSLGELLGSIEIPKRVSSTRRNHRQAQEHVLAERKRREKLSHRFISLSALLPKIKKMDKATVLEDTSKYIKNLQNRVKELEESLVTEKKFIQESASSMRRSKFRNGYEDAATSFNETNSLPCSTDYDSGIKARISGSNVLVKIYLRRNSPVLALKALFEMERLHFSIMSNNVLPISETAGLITITAQMSEEFVMTAMDLVQGLQSALSICL